MRLSAPLFALTAAVADWAFGPEDCVTLGKSEAGTCVLKTHCLNIDTAEFEFAFVCTSADGSKVKHTYGEGGFEADEVYDTDVQCASCDPPPGVTAHAPGHAPAAKTPATVAESRATLQKFAAAAGKTQSLPPASAAFYGPSGCVATYRCPEGTCIIQTRCKPADVAPYNFGLTCVDSAGDTTRHLFGAGSFDAVETFDTLIECKLCLGLDGEQIPGGNVTIAGTLSDDVAVLKQEMKELQQGLREVQQRLGIGASANTTAAPTTTAAPAPAANGTVLHSKGRGAHAAPTAAPVDAMAADVDEADEGFDDDAPADDGSPAETTDSGYEREESSFLRHGRRERKHHAPKRRRKRRRQEDEAKEDDDLDALMADALD